MYSASSSWRDLDHAQPSSSWRKVLKVLQERTFNAKKSVEVFARRVLIASRAAGECTLDGVPSELDVAL